MYRRNTYQMFRRYTRPTMSKTYTYPKGYGHGYGYGYKGYQGNGYQGYQGYGDGGYGYQDNGKGHGYPYSLIEHRGQPSPHVPTVHKEP